MSYRVLFSLSGTRNVPSYGLALHVQELDYPQRELVLEASQFGIVNSDETTELPPALVRLCLQGRLLVGLPHPGAVYNLTVRPNRDSELWVEMAGERHRVPELILSFERRSAIGIQVAY